MLRKAHLTPDEALATDLGKRPKATECALVLDLDRLISWDQPTYEDSKGRTWHRLLYAGDDIAFRFGLRRALAKGGPRLIVVTGNGEQDDEPIVLTHLADVLAMVEGDPIDLSLLAYFRRLFRKVSPPIDELHRHKQAFVGSIAGLIDSYNQFKLRWGEPDSWTRGQLLAILLMARYPSLRLEEIWCDELDPDAFLLHALQLIVRPEIDEDDAPMLRRVIREASRLPDIDFADPWLSLQPGELAAYLVLRDFLGTHNTRHPSTLLAGKLTFTVDPDRLEQRAPNVIAGLAENSETWSRINRLAESYLAGRRVGEVVQLVGSELSDLLAVVQDVGAAPLVLRETVAGILRRVFAGASFEDTAWTVPLRDHPVLRSGEKTAVANQAASLAECLLHVAEINTVLVQPAPVGASAEELLDSYVDQGLHLLELKLSQAFARLETAGDTELIQLGEQYLLAGPNALKTRLREYLDRIDEQLATFIRPDPEAFIHGRRSAIRLLRDTVYKHRRRFERIWILLFDGMRLDTWDSVIWPILSEFYEPVEPDAKPRFALLPTKTDIARRSLFAGAVAKGWKNYYGRVTRDERILAARALGVLKNEVDSDVRFVAEAETEQARRKMGFNDADAKGVNILIYPISDDLGHYHSDTLASLNEKIRQQTVTQQGVRGILDDLRARVGSNDLLLVTSDHGFIELPADHRVAFTSAEAHAAGRVLEDAVNYRYLTNLDVRKGRDIGPNVTVEWQEPAAKGKRTTTFTLPVGSNWYHREGGRPTRYAHGGVSMAEMAIPAMLLKPIAQKEARIEFLEVPEQVELAEDEPSTVTLRIRNAGNVAANFELIGTTNLREGVLSERGQLDVGRSRQVRLELTPRYATDASRQAIPEKTTRRIVLQLGHTNLAGRMVTPEYGKTAIRVIVKPKAIKFVTDEMFKGLPD